VISLSKVTVNLSLIFASRFTM